MKTLIIIPARYHSTRLPGKPLAMIAGQSLLQRVIALAHSAAQDFPDVKILVATDDERIGAHAEKLGAPWVMTPESCPTGTDRVFQALQMSTFEADFIVNLQGDAPFTPPHFIKAMIEAFRTEPCDTVTPVTQLTWDELDALRESKKITPFSGTTAVFDPVNGLAHWFSKNILPAVRKEEKMRAESALSPVWRHIGLYGFSRTMLERFMALPEGTFEKLEGLEQLRILENGYKIRCVPVSYNGLPAMSGIDSPEDIIRAEALLAPSHTP